MKSEGRYYNGVWKDRTTRYSAVGAGDRPIFAVVLAIFATSAAIAIAQDRRDEKTDPTQRILALDPRWTVAFDTAPSAPAGFDEQTAYVPLKGGELVSVGLDRGDVRWKVELATAFSPATGDGLVFAAGDDAVLAYEDRTGKVVWRTSVGGPLGAPVYFDAGTVIATRSDGELLTLRSQDGAVVWRQALASPLAVSPVTAGDRLYVGLSDQRVLALDRESGQQLWAYPAGDAISGLLALDDQLVVGTRGNQLVSLRLDKPRVRWFWTVGADIAGAAVADDDRIYFAALDNMLRAVNRGNGNLQWTQPLPSRPAGGPLRTGDVVIVPTVSADIGAYLAKTGKPAFVIKATGELGGLPFLREMPRPTAPRLIVSREGMLQGFAPRYEPPPAPMPDPLPGTKVGG